MKSKLFVALYALFGLAALFSLGCSHYYGWAMTRTEELSGVPKTIRDNPGAYRTHYFGGK